MSIRLESSDLAEVVADVRSALIDHDAAVNAAEAPRRLRRKLYMRQYRARQREEQAQDGSSRSARSSPGSSS